MATWLALDLATTSLDWMIAFWHHPPYSKGSHDSDGEGALIQMRENFLPILEAGGVDLVLSGHSHSYERSYLIDGHYGTSDTLTPSNILNGGDGRENGAGAYIKPTLGPAGNEGATYVVAGSLGKLSSSGTLDHPAMFISIRELGSLVIDVLDNRMDIKFLRETGVIDDYFSLIKSSGAVPAAPHSLSAISDDSLVILDWIGSFGATSYNVKRSTINGGPYTVIANPAGTRFTDTGVINGVPLFYVVSANNSNGESANSEELMAIPGPVSVYAPTDDAKVRSDNPTRNEGLSDTLRVRASSSGTYHSYLKFNVFVASGQVSSAVLRLYVVDGSVDGGTIFTTETSWEQSTINWDNAPALTGTPVAAIGPVENDTWIEIDVTPFVTTNGEYSWGLSSTSSNSAYYSSKEGANPPELVVSAGELVPPVSEFVGSPVNGPQPLSVNFNDQSSGGPTALGMGPRRPFKILYILIPVPAPTPSVSPSPMRREMIREPKPI